VEGVFFGFAIELSDKVSGKSNKMRKALDLLRAAIQGLDKDVTAVGGRGRAFKGVIKGAKGTGKALRGSGRSAKGFSGRMKQLTARLRKTSTSFSFMQKVVVGLGAAFTAASLARAVRAIGRAFTEVVKTGAEFGRAMKFAGAVARASAGQLIQLREEAKRIGATTAFTATQAAEGFVILGQAGKTTAESLLILKNAVNLAGASQVDLKKATQATLDAMATFQIPAKDAQETVDTLARSATSAFQTLGDLSVGLKKAGPTAKAAGRSLTETAAAIGVFANAGVRGGEGGTALRNVLAKIQIPTKNLTRALDFLGLKMKDLSPATNDINTIFNRLRPLTQRADLAFKLFGLRTTPAFTAAMLKGKDAVADMIEKMKDGKTAAELYIAQMDSVAGALKIVTSAAEAVQIELFDIIKEQLKQDLTTFSSLVQQASIAVKNLAGPIRIVFSTFTSVFGIIFRKTEDLTSSLQKNFKTLAKTGVDSRAAIRDVVGPLTIALIIIKVKVLDFVSGFIDGLGEAFEFFKTIFETLRPILEPILDFFAELLGLNEEGISKAQALGKVFGVLFGLFLGFIAIKATLIIPLFVFDTFKKFLVVGIQVFAGVGNAAIGLRKLLIGTEATSVLSSTSRLGKGFTFLKVTAVAGFTKIAVVLSTVVVAAWGAVTAAASFFMATILPIIVIAGAIAAAFAVLGVVISKIWEVAGDDSLSFANKTKFVVDESFKSILGFIGGFVGVSQETIDLFVDFLSTKIGEGLFTAFIFFKQLGQNILLWMNQQLESFAVFTVRIGLFFKGLIKGIQAAFSAVSLKTLIFGSDEQRAEELAKADAAFAKVNDKRKRVNKLLDKDLEDRQLKEKTALQSRQARELDLLEEGKKSSDAAFAAKVKKADELRSINNDIANRDKKAADGEVKRDKESAKRQKEKAKRGTDLSVLTQREGESQEDFLKRIQDVDISDLVLGRGAQKRTTEEVEILKDFGELSARERRQAADQLQAAITTRIAEGGGPAGAENLDFLKKISDRTKFEAAGTAEQTKTLEKLQLTLSTLKDKTVGPQFVREVLISEALKPVTAQIIKVGENLAGTKFKEFEKQDLQEEFRKREAFINERRKKQGEEALKTDLSQLTDRKSLESLVNVLGVRVNRIREKEAREETKRREDELGKLAKFNRAGKETKAEALRRRIEGRLSVTEEKRQKKRVKIAGLEQAIIGEQLKKSLEQKNRLKLVENERDRLIQSDRVLVAENRARLREEKLRLARARPPRPAQRQLRRTTRAVSVVRRQRAATRVEAAEIAKTAVGGAPQGEVPVTELQVVGKKFETPITKGREIKAVEVGGRTAGAPVSSTFIFNEGSVVIQVAMGDPEEIAKTFLPILRRLQEKEDARVTGEAFV